MSTKNTTTSTNSYAPGSLGTYESLQGPATQAIGNQISNPNGSQLMLGLRGFGQGAIGGFSRGLPAASGGGSNGAAYSRSQATIGGQFNQNLLLGGAQLRNQAIGAAMNYRPLQTGGTQVQSTYGAGTWAGPLIGAGLAVGGAFLGGPAGMKAGQSLGKMLQPGTMTPGNAGEMYGPQQGPPDVNFGDSSMADNSMNDMDNISNITGGSSYGGTGGTNYANNVWGM